MMLIPTACFAFLALALSSASPAQAGPGDYDPAFSGDGKLKVNLHASAVKESAVQVLVQQDGKIVLVGNDEDRCVNLARFHADGSLDPSFGADTSPGKQFTCVGQGTAFAAALQEDDKIVVTGEINGDLAVLRYQAKGILDPNFNAAGTKPGVLVLARGTTSSGKDLVIQKDGDILVAGQYRDPTRYSLLARVLPNGTFDENFYDDGVYLINANRLFNTDNYFTAIALTPAGGFAAGDFISNSTLGAYGIIHGFLGSGPIDPGFGEDGLAAPDLAREHTLNDIGVGSDGKIIFTGLLWDPNLQDNFMYSSRLLADGRLDEDYGDGGLFLFKFGEGFETGYRLAVQDNGQSVFLGSGDGKIGIARLNGNGSPNADFGNAGKRLVDFGGTSQGGSSVALQADGKILVAGTADGDFALARLMGNTADVGLTAEWAAAGGELTYRFTVHNQGPDSASPVTFTDEIPPELRLIRADVDGRPCEGGAGIQCDLGRLEPGSRATVTILGEVVSLPSTGLTFDNTAAVSAGQVVEPNPSDNNLTVTATLDASGDGSSGGNAVNGGSTASGAAAGGCMIQAPGNAGTPGPQWMAAIVLLALPAIFRKRF